MSARGSAALGIFGIRHHGPGSARSVLAALEAFAPEIVLIEGPPDADAIAPLTGDPEMRPPVAILAYAEADSKRAVFYPFATFSPEWQALKYARERGLPARFIDLPLANVLARRKPVAPHHHAGADDDAGDASDAGGAGDVPVVDARETAATAAPEEDPLDVFARVAGFADGESWWDAFVERRPSAGAAFEALEELMRELRAGRTRVDADEPLREAAMRQGVRLAQKSYDRVAVVCGAWHAPALRDAVTAKNDADLLRGLPKTKVATTWIPWTNGRLSLHGGYGAGVASPGWYEHLWNGGDAVVEGWMARAARVLREGGIDVAASHAIEATRLARTLAAIRDAHAVGLGELTEAIRTVYAFGEAAPMALLETRLIVGERMGSVPEHVARIPLAADLAREQKRLRLPAEVQPRALELDLRKPGDLERSTLLHRLSILGVPWGRPLETRTGGGTFWERWTLEWSPEFVIALIDASPLGNTIALAAAGRVAERCSSAKELSELTALLEATLRSGLGEAIATVLAALDALAARTRDVAHLLDAIPPLARTARYGDVRQTDARRVAGVLDALVTRACIGLLNATTSLDDDAAAQTYRRLLAVDAALRTLDVPAQREAWLAALASVAGDERVHGLVAGRAVRLRYDAKAIDVAALRNALALALGRATGPEDAAAWIEGAFRDSGTILVHEANLLGAVDAWLQTLGAEAFIETLPLVRRTFGTFASAERGAIARNLSASGGGAVAVSQAPAVDIDWSRARALLPAFRELLGMPEVTT